jgi:hypothetical protein
MTYEKYYPPSTTPKTNPNKPNFKNRKNTHNLLLAKDLRRNLPFLPRKKRTQNEPNSCPPHCLECCLLYWGPPLVRRRRIRVADLSTKNEHKLNIYKELRKFPPVGGKKTNPIQTQFSVPVSLSTPCLHTLGYGYILLAKLN